MLHYFCSLLWGRNKCLHFRRHTLTSWSVTSVTHIDLTYYTLTRHCVTIFRRLWDHVYWWYKEKLLIVIVNAKQHTVKHNCVDILGQWLWPDIGWSAWLSGRTSVSGQRSFAVLWSTCRWWVTTYVGKPSAIGQPTRLTQPFILSESIND